MAGLWPKSQGAGGCDCAVYETVPARVALTAAPMTAVSSLASTISKALPWSGLMLGLAALDPWTSIYRYLILLFPLFVVWYLSSLA